MSVLFGIARTSPDAHGASSSSLELGARLVDHEGTALEVRRKGSSRKLVVTDEDFGQDKIDQLLSGLSRDLYGRLYCLDHEELRNGSEDLLDANGEIGRLLFGATSGMTSVSATLRRLEKRASDLFSPKKQARTPVVNAALRAYTRLMNEAREQRVRAGAVDDLRQALATASRAAQEVAGELRDARTELVRLQRLQITQPLVKKRDELLARLAEVAGPAPPGSWASEVESAQARWRELDAEWRGLRAQKDQLDDTIETIHVDHDVLERAGAMDELVTGLDQFRSASRDAVKRRGELVGKKKNLGAILERLGLTHDDSRRVDEATLATVEDLAKMRTAIDTDRKHATNELSDAEAASRQARQQLDDLAPAVDVGDLRIAIKRSEEWVRVERELVQRGVELARLESEARELADALGVREPSSARLLDVPDSEAIGAERERVAALGQRRSSLDERASALEERHAQSMDAIAAISGLAGIPDPSYLEETRARRQDIWQQIRALVDEPVPPERDQLLPALERYENAVREADRAADDRYAYAGELARLHELQAQASQHKDDLKRIEDERQQVERTDAAATAAWKLKWSAVGTPPPDPETWRERHRKLVELVDSVRSETDQIAHDDAEVARRRDELGATLAAIGVSTSSGQLEPRLQRAGEMLKEAEELEQARGDMRSALRKSREDVERRKSEVAKIDEKLAEWKPLWEDALARLGLPATTTPAGALAAVHEHRSLVAARSEVAELQDRIEGIEEDYTSFTTRAAAAASGLLDDRSRSPADVVEELRQRLEDARRSQARLDELDSQRQKLDESLVAVEGDRRTVLSELEDLRSSAGLADDVVLEVAVGIARQVEELKGTLAEIERRLGDAGSGLALAEIVAEAQAESRTLDELSSAHLAVKDRVELLEQRQNEASRRVGEAEHAISSLGDSQAAADIEQQAQAALAAAAEGAAEYAPTLIAAEMLRRVMSDYGERHRGPIIERATEIFSILTGGAFTGLVPDVEGDRNVLLARRGAEELLATDELSDGTRDQLYLALRLAGIEHQLDHRSAPVVLDDILVHFDDERARAALGVLGALGGRTQVLLFTHHEEVVAQARATLPPEQLGVVQLPARSHEHERPVRPDEQIADAL